MPTASLAMTFGSTFVIVVLVLPAGGTVNCTTVVPLVSAWYQTPAFACYAFSKPISRWRRHDEP